MSAELLKAYLKMVLEEKQAELDETGAASGGGNVASAVSGFIAPLGTSASPRSHRKRRKKTLTQK